MSTVASPSTVRPRAPPTSRSPKWGRWVLPALALVGLVVFTPAVSAVETAPDTVTVHVVAHGWHSGLVIPAAVIDADAWPARRAFPDADYFEVGWGDRAFYQASDPGLWLGLRALLWPSPGVLHIVALRGAPAQHVAGAPMATLEMSREGARRLVAAISASHERDAQGQPIAFGPSLYGQGRFYASVERFHLFATCNVWVARRLRDAGVSVRPALAITTGMLFAQLAQGAQHRSAASAPWPNPVQAPRPTDFQPSATPN